MKYRLPRRFSFPLLFIVFVLVSQELPAQQKATQVGMATSMSSLEATIHSSDIPATNMDVWNIASEDGIERAVSVCNVKPNAAHTFLCENLPASRYLVTFTLVRNNSIYSLYYPGSFYLREAQLIELGESEERHIEVSAGPFQKGSLQLILPKGVKDTAVSLKVVRWDHPGVELPVVSSSLRDENDGQNFIYRDLPLGRYVARITWTDGDKTKQQVVSCDVASDHSCIHRVQDDVPGAVIGSLKTEDGDSMPAYFIARSTSESFEERIDVMPPSEFRATDLPPGTYRFELSRTDGRWMEIETADGIRPAHNTVQVTAGTPTYTKLRVRGGENSLRGEIASESDSHGPYHLLMLGSNTGIRRDLLTAQDGAFSFDHLPDDEYLLYSWEADDLPYTSESVWNEMQTCATHIDLKLNRMYETAAMKPCSMRSEW